MNDRLTSEVLGEMADFPLPRANDDRRGAAQRASSKPTSQSSREGGGTHRDECMEDYEQFTRRFFYSNPDILCFDDSHSGSRTGERCHSN
ncbi:hypothetical protein ACVWYH_005559 [Bradyrhizobium sp. GM24.11]